MKLIEKHIHRGRIRIDSCVNESFSPVIVLFEQENCIEYIDLFINRH